MDQKVILWDWNGTLFPDTVQSCQALNVVEDAYHLPRTTVDRYRACFTLPFSEHYKRIGFPESLIADLPALQTIWHEAYKKVEPTIILREGTAALLEALQAAGVSNVIISNHIEGQILAQLRRLGIDRYIVSTTAFKDVGEQQNNIGVFKTSRVRQFMEAQNIPRDHAVIVGDTTYEIEMAHTLGLHSISVTDGFHTEERLRKEANDKDVFVHSIPELRTALEAVRGFPPLPVLTNKCAMDNDVFL